MDITAEIVTAFRDHYDEFSDQDTWPDKVLTRALEDGDDETGKRWGAYKPRSLKLRGMFAFAAHRLVTSRINAAVTESGGLAVVANAVAGKSVADESVSYAVPTQTMDERIRNGDMTLTAYGLEFLRLRKMAGAGALCV